MKRLLPVVGIVCTVAAGVLLALGVREGVVIAPLFVIGLIGLAVSRWGHPGAAGPF